MYIVVTAERTVPSCQTVGLIIVRSYTRLDARYGQESNCIMVFYTTHLLHTWDYEAFSVEPNSKKYVHASGV